jgi:glycerol-3-phosphate dehydrogenase
MREPSSENLSGRLYDVAIIGGGINGASAAQHLAAAGYDVLLVEKGDFGSGSTSRSSRLLHCGLRYLAPGRSIFDFVLHPTRLATAVRMAKQGMEARSEFVRTAPERTRSMRFCFPIFKGGPYRGWQVDLAFRILGAIGPGDVPLDYERLPAAAARTMPLLKWLRNLDDLQSVATFREYQFDWPERACVDAILDAERLGATVRNHTVGRIVRREGDHWVLAVGAAGEPNGEAEVRARAVLLMAGIWIDDVARSVRPQARRRILGTKGAHILVRLPPECADFGIATLNSRQEPFYCIPWRGYHYFGPTETVYEGDKDDIRVTAEERDWLVKEANNLLPALRLSADDVLMTWAGVRPLTYDDALPSGNRSRAVHDLAADGMPDMFAMSAGPVMTHRSAGRELVAHVSRRIAPSRSAAAPDYRPAKFPACTNSPALVADNANVKLSDLRHAVSAERARTLSDVLLRRVGMGWDCKFTDEELARAADVVGSELGWDDTRKANEIASFQAEISHLFRPHGALRPRVGEGLQPMASTQR